jgi:hypothetical protein
LNISSQAGLDLARAIIAPQPLGAGSEPVDGVGAVEFEKIAFNASQAAARRSKTIRKTIGSNNMSFLFFLSSPSDFLSAGRIEGGEEKIAENGLSRS